MESKGISSRERKTSRKQILVKKKAIDEIMKAASSPNKDDLASFPAFCHYQRSGLSVYLESGYGNKLSSPVKLYIQNLLKANMEGRYGSEWPTEEKVKRREMVAPEARYIFVHEEPNANGNQAISVETERASTDVIHGRGPIVGFVHYRFTVEEEIPVLYVYELQLEPHVQRKGLGKFLMQLIELIAHKSQMGAVVLTVQKENFFAMNFYMSKLRYIISTISPSRVDPLIGLEKSYEILCKTFDHEAKATLQISVCAEMAWLMVIVTLLVMWIATLCKILHTTSSSSKAAFLNDSGSLHQRSVLLVIAHPDDESMFFTPTINYLTSRGHNLHIMCMSTGNADGMGNIRKEELHQASAVLKIRLPQVKILDHPDLQDGFGKEWNFELLASIVDEYILSHAIDLIITFDNYGVSSHCNHRDLNRGIRKLLHETAKRDIEAWELISINILRKYSGPVDICLSLISAMLNQNGELHCLLNERPNRSYSAMAQHRSQWIWFRKLFVVFSSYTYVNTLKKID